MLNTLAMCRIVWLLEELNLGDKLLYTNCSFGHSDLVGLLVRPDREVRGYNAGHWDKLAPALSYDKVFII